MKDWLGEEKLFQGIEGGLTKRRPIPGQVLLCKVDERVSDVGVVRNMEGMHILDFS